MKQNARARTIKSKFLESIREVIFGMEDGLVSTMGVITGIDAGTENSFIVVLTGFVVVCVESLSMAAGTYLSSKSLHQIERARVRKLQHDITKNPLPHKRVLSRVYEAHGFTKREVRMIVDRVAQHKHVWTEELALHALHIVPGNGRRARQDAFFMGISYIVAGSIPVLPYLMLPLSVAMIFSIFSTVAALFILGYGKSILAKIHPWRGGVEMMLVSSGAAALGFTIGKLVSYMFGVHI